MGQRLVLLLESGDCQVMEYADPQTWACTIDWEGDVIRYRYAVESKGVWPETVWREDDCL